MVGMLSPITAQIGQPERVDLGQSILGGMQVNQNLQRGKLQNQAMQQDITEVDYQTNMRNLQVMNRLLKQARQYPPEQRAAFAQSLDQNMLAAIGVTPDKLAQTPMDDAGLDQLIGQTDAVLSSAMPQQQIDIGTYNPRDYTPESWAEFVKTKDAAKLKRYESSQVVKIGGVDYLVDRTTGERTPITSLNEVTENVQAISSAGEKGKLEQQLDLTPRVKAATEAAILDTRRLATNATINNSAQKALAVYETGVKHLTAAMEKPWTGSIVGALPAISSDARAADGAVAAMAPILKEMFRSAGEGNFTDKDQELLINMLPTRQDDANSRKSKLDMVDAIVRSKLAPLPTAQNQGGSGQGAMTPQIAPQPQAQKQGGQIMIDANGNRAMVYPDGTFEEL